MKNDTEVKEVQKTTVMQILIPLVIVWGAIQIAQAGYVAGKWLYLLLH
jgi:hypothetical protein